MLEVRALGRLEVCYQGVPIRFPTQKVAELLCYLLLHANRTLPRDVAAEALWPMRPPGRARRSLSTSLWRLRDAIRSTAPSAPEYIRAQRATIAFDTSCAYSFDVEDFQSVAHSAAADGAPFGEHILRQLRRAVDTYRGPLLSGTYSDWCLAERERLRLVLVKALKKLQQCHRHLGSYEAGIATGHRLLAIDPLQEDVHRELMRCFVASGERAHALEQYRRCSDVLAQELAVQPMTETRALHLRIRTDGLPDPLRTAVHESPSSYAAALTRFQQALEALESSWTALQAVPTSEVLATRTRPD